jgi:parallel beta-helix repeat protein
MIRARLVSCAAVLALVGTTFAVAGPLDPPAGPIKSSYKTLTEVEPRIAINATNTPGDADSMFRITKMGSYYLAGNITGAGGVHCIEVSSDDVTIDLNGMTITGSPTSTGGIFGEGVRVNLVVRNGTIKGIGAGSGVSFSISSSKAWMIENVAALANADDGIRVPSGSIVRSCRTTNNADTGIQTSERSQIIECVSEFNLGDGIIAGQSSLVSRTISRNNTSDGIDAGNDGVKIFDCISSGNGGNGISGQNAAHISGCVVRSNSLVGIATAATSIIERNDVTFSGGHGIAFGTNSVVRDNASHSNGTATAGAGIFTSSGRSRIEGNLCNDNDFGIRVTTSPNFIARNIVGNNGTLNWDIAIGNRCLVVSSVASGAITGNSGGVGAGSSDPNANFTN